MHFLANSLFLPLILSCKVVSLIPSHPGCQPEPWFFPILHCSNWVRSAAVQCQFTIFTTVISSPSSVPPRCLDPSYFSPACSRSPASQFFCPCSPFHRGDSKARTWTLCCWRASRTAIGFRKRLGLCSSACLFLLFSFSHFSRCPRPSPPGSFPRSLLGSV